MKMLHSRKGYSLVVYDTPMPDLHMLSVHSPYAELAAPMTLDELKDAHAELGEYIAKEEQEKAASALDRAVTISTKGFYALIALATLFYAMYVLSGAFMQG